MIKSKINSSRLDMHRKAKNCRLSFENVTNGQPFISRSAATQTRWVRLFELLQLYHIPVQKILSSLRMARAIRSNQLSSSVRKDRRSYPFQNNRQLFELLVAIHWKNTRRCSCRKKIHQLFEFVQAVPRNDPAFCLASKLKCVFECKKTLS